MKTILDRFVLIQALFFLFSPPVLAAIPVANAGSELYATKYVRIGHIAPSSRVELDGTGSFDPDGDALTYQWTLLGAPAGSAASLYSATSQAPVFYADKEGKYTIQLVVSDGVGESNPDIVVVEAKKRHLETVNWGNPYSDNSFDVDCLAPSIAMNDNGVVIEVHGKASGNLYYRVGQRSTAGSIHWGGITRYTSGFFPSISVNNDGLVVEAHSGTGVYVGTLFYNVGVVNEGNKTITFLKSDNYTLGAVPSIAVNDSGVVVEVHSALDLTRLFYKVGVVNDDATISFGGAQYYNTGHFPSIDINNHDVVVEAHEETVGSDLYSRTGTVNRETKRITFKSSSAYTKGKTPSVAINDDGIVVGVHTGEFLTDLYYKLGSSNGNSLVWGDADSYAVAGLTPSVALNNNYEFLEINYTWSVTTELNGLLYHSTSDFMPARAPEKWMTLTPSLQCRNLKEAYLPGTHDSAAYDFRYGMYSPTYQELLELVILGLGYTLPPGLENPFSWVVSQFGQATATLIEGLAQDMAQAQNVSVRDQLEGGVRFLDLRIWMPDPAHDSLEEVDGDPDNYGKFFIHHSAVGNELVEILEEVAAYMETVKNQKELLVVQGWVNARELVDEDHHRLLQLIVDHLGEYLYLNDGFSVDGDETNVLLETPIRDIVNDGSRIVFVYKDHGEKYFLNHGINDSNRHYFWLPFDFEQWANSNSVGKLRANQGDAIGCFFSECQDGVCDAGKDCCCNSGTWTCSECDCEPFYLSKLFRLQYILTPGTADFVNGALALLGDFSPGLHSLSQGANQHLSVFLEEQSSFPGNLLTVDYFQESDVVQSAIQLNQVDNIPSTSNATIYPEPNAAGWNNTDSWVELSIEEECPAGSGLNELHYQLSGAHTGSDTIFGNSGMVELTNEGVTIVTYWSVDAAGNEEETKTLEVKIDKTPPLIVVTADPGILWASNNKLVDVVVDGTVEDALSGVASVSFRLVDEYGEIEPVISNFGETIQLEATRKGQDQDGRQYLITVTGIDLADNEAEQSVQVLCPHDQSEHP